MTAPRDDGVVDAGVQSERTRLAWDRTALAFGTFGALLVHAGHTHTSPVAVALGIAIVCSGGAVYLLGRRRYHALVGSLRRGGPIPRTAALHFVGALAVAIALISAGVLAFS